MENKISSLTNLQPLNPNTLPEEVAKAISFLTNYYENVDKYPVRSQVEPGYLQQITPENAPTLPESLEKILKDVETNIIPGLTHWQSPNFFAHFPASISNAALVGDILCSGINVVGFNWISSPAATELESIVTEWMAKLLNLPNDFHFSGGGGGVIHGTTCEAVVCTLAAARDRALNVVGEEKIGKLVVYASDQTHFCFQKAAKIVGILPRNFRVIPTCISKEFALSPDDLKSAIEADVKLGLVPMYICASVGATASASVDPIKGLGLVAQAYGSWLHVDAAYAGNACICPEYRHYINGVEFADSFSLNLHKWLLTTLECCCLWLKNPKLLVNSLSTDAEVLRNKATDLGNVIDYKDWQIALTRRFRALKLWVIIRRHGSSNLMSHIRSDIELSKYFETLIEKDERFEMVVPRKFALVCFRLRPVDRDGKGNVMNQKFLEAVNSSGKAYMTHAVLGGMFVIRCSIGGTLTSKVHVDGLWALLQEKASFMLMGFGHCFKTKLQENISTLISLE